MIEPDPFQHSCPYANNLDSSLNEFLDYGVCMDEPMTYFDSVYPPLFTTTDYTLETYCTNFSGTTSNNEFENYNYNFHVNEMQVAFPVDCSSVGLEDLVPDLSMEIENMKDWLEGCEKSSASSHHLSIDLEGNLWNLSPSMISSDTSMDATSIQPPLNLPTEDMEIDNEVGANHLAKAHVEAMENEQTELAEVIVRRINEKVSPVGGNRERLLYHSFQPLDKQADNYLKQESCKIFDAASEAIYRMFPNGMFAHFRANSAILEAIPYDAEVSHIVDFDMGEGVQWASMIVALAQRQELLQQFGITSQQTTLKLTSIKWKNEDWGNSPSQWRFEETKKRLLYYADSHGLKLKVEEMKLHDLVTEIKTARKRKGRREWLAFNCMQSLPHMGRRRSRRYVMEFLSAAKDLIANSANNKTIDTGIVTYGDGDTWEKMENCSCFGSFFDSYMKHYQTLLESMEWNFPTRLAEARITMECLFVAPYVSSFALLETWKEIKEVSDFQPGFGLQGLRLSRESLMEAKLMVREGESMYSVRVEGENANEMVLEWRGTPLVRFSAWK